MSEPVKIISSSDLEGGPLTPGMSRSQAFASEDVWVGEVHTDPGAMSGWHHHGDHATYGRVIEGTARVEFGPGGETALEAGPGDFFYMPPHTVHREGNPGGQMQVLMVVRLGSGPTVINLDGPEAG
ncbi:MAG: cupin domain-containing protein [Dehalococcoidia bacterium]